MYSALGIKAFDLCVGLAVRDGFADFHMAVRLAPLLRRMGDAYDLPAAGHLLELHGDLLQPPCR